MRLSPLAFVALALTAKAPSYTLLLAGLSAPLTFAAVLLYNRTALVARLVSFLFAVSAALVTFSGSSLAIFVALAAALVVLAATSRLSSPSVVSSAVLFCASAMFLASVPTLAVSENLPQVLFLALLVGVSSAVLPLATARVSSPVPRRVSVAMASMLLALPVAFTSSADSAAISSGISASPNIELCPDLGGDTIKSVECYSAVLIDEYRTNGLPSAIQLVERAYAAPAPLGRHFSENCHESLHFLGKAAALDVTGEIRDVIAQGTDLCAAGFGHGIWEMAYGSMTTDKLVEKVPTICRGWEGYNRSEEGSSGIGCRHILGHTLATRFRAHIEDVAAVCLIRDPQVDQNSELTQDETIAQNNCLAGLFMENFLDLNRFRTSDVDTARPFATCEHPKILVDERLMWGCYNEIGAMVVPWSDFDLQKSLEACRDQVAKNSIPEFIEISCYDSIARSIGPVIDRDPVSLQKACADIADKRLLAYCVRGLAGVVAFDSSNLAQARNLCNTALSDQEAVRICLDRVGEIAKALDSSKVAGDKDAPPNVSPPLSEQDQSQP